MVYMIIERDLYIEERFINEYGVCSWLMKYKDGRVHEEGIVICY